MVLHKPRKAAPPRRTVHATEGNAAWQEADTPGSGVASVHGEGTRKVEPSAVVLDVGCQVAPAVAGREEVQG